MTKTINDDKINDHIAYEARGIVARINQIGKYKLGPLASCDVYQYLTLDCGPGKDKVLVEFVGPAPYDDETREIKINDLKEGDFVIDPGFVYRRRAWTQPLIAEHLLQLKRYKPKMIITSEVDRDAPAENIVIDPHNIAKN